VENSEIRMPDKLLSILVVSLIVLVTGHDIDHLIRGDYGSGSPAEAWPVALVVIAKYAILGGGLYFYVKGKVGPGFWAILAGASVALAWLAHFSPFSEQTPQFIFRAYDSPAGGMLAVAWLAALVLVLVTTTLYAEYLWARVKR